MHIDPPSDATSRFDAADQNALLNADADYVIEVGDQAHRSPKNRG